MKFDVKKWLADQSVGFGEFKTNSGNGEAVPVYELKNGKLVLKMDEKTGEVFTHNLYNDIQASAHVNDYLKILNDNPDALEQVKFSTLNGQREEVAGFDYSNLGSFDDLVQASQKLKAAGYNSFDDVINKYKNFKKSSKEVVDNNQNFDVKNDEIKEEK